MNATTNKLAIDNLLKEGDKAANEVLVELNRLAKVTQNWQAICNRAGKRLEPLVRTALDECWSRTGLHRYSDKKNYTGGDYSGALYDAWVTKSIIQANQLGILVYIAKNMPDAVYKRAGAFQHGAVIGLGKNANSKKSVLKYKFKKEAEGKSKSLGGGVRTLEAHPISFDGGQLDNLAQAFIRFVNDEIENIVA